MDRSDRDPMRTLSVARITIGAAVLVAPRTMVRWFVGAEPTRELKFLARLFAGRELALGAATLDALDNDAGPVRLLELNMLVDGVDGVAAVLAIGRLPRHRRWLVVLGAAAAVAVTARLRDDLVRGRTAAVSARPDADS